MKNIQVKGRKYESELAKYIRDHTGLNAFRTPLSGGGKNLDPMADLLGTPGLHIEAKRTERTNIHEAMKQAEAAIRRSYTSDAPVVITRRNNMETGDSICAMRLKDFIMLYSVFLLHSGYITRPAALAPAGAGPLRLQGGKK